jgi:hypothetical protein
MCGGIVSIDMVLNVIKVHVKMGRGAFESRVGKYWRCNWKVKMSLVGMDKRSEG